MYVYRTYPQKEPYNTWEQQHDETRKKNIIRNVSVLEFAASWVLELHFQDLLLLLACSVEQQLSLLESQMSRKANLIFI